MSLTSSASSNITTNNPERQDKGVQTVIKVYPFILPPHLNRASVTSAKKIATTVIADPSPVNYQFYYILQYCPYHDIQLDSLRVIDLPRETKLQFTTQRFSEDTLKRISLADDDGVAEVCDDLLLRLRTGNKATYREAATQTDLTRSRKCQAALEKKNRRSDSSGTSGSTQYSTDSSF